MRYRRLCVRAIDGGEEEEEEEEGVEGSGDHVAVGMLKIQVSVKGEEEGEERPEQMIRLPCGSCGDMVEEVGLDMREGSLAIVDVICSLYDALLDGLV